MEILARTDYAVRAMLGLSQYAPALVKIDTLVADQELPRKFLESILADLRRAGLVVSRRGSDGGYALARSADEISIGSVIRAVDGPLAAVRGQRPDQTSYTGVAEHLPGLWVAVRASLRQVLDGTSLQQVLDGDLPDHVRELLDRPESWLPR
jgi:Rrf2 family protein